MSRPTTWPGGIPPHIRCHPGVDDYFEDFETHGWRLFVKENWIPRSGDSQGPDEVNQRRSLIEKWALMEQPLRDDYCDRGHNTPPSADYSTECFSESENDSYILPFFMVITPLDTPRKRALWTKMRILFYNFEDKDIDMPVINASEFEFVDQEPYSTVCPNVTPETYMCPSLEMADFRGMEMTRAGTVIFSHTGTHVFVDDFALEHGMVLMCSFAVNGEPKRRFRINPLDMEYPMQMTIAMGKSLDMVMINHLDPIELTSEETFCGEQINMDLPILRLLRNMVDSVLINLPGDEDSWEDYITEIAPGYLEEEEAGGGFAPNYDHSNFPDDSN